MGARSPASEYEFEFRARLWQYDGDAGSWCFVTLPREVAARIHAQMAGKAKPGGSLRVTAAIGGTRWQTSIFRDRKRATYLLPVKAAVRKKEQLRTGDVAEVVLVLPTVEGQ